MSVTWTYQPPYEKLEKGTELLSINNGSLSHYTKKALNYNLE